jgi:hypothetical protein
MATGSAAARQGDHVTDHPSCAESGELGTPAQPGCCDHRSSDWGGAVRCLGIQPPLAGIPELGSLLGATVNTFNGVIDINPTRLDDPFRHTRSVVGSDQPAQGDRIQLANIPERERPQVRTQLGRGPHPSEYSIHARVPLQIGVIDAGRTGHHRRYQTHPLQMWVRRCRTPTNSR